jgi:DNA mismatch repair protein MutS
MVLEMLEQGEREGNAGKKALIDDLPLFSAAPVVAAAPVKSSVVEDRLKTVLPDELTPREALAILYELKDLEKG